MGLTLNRIEAVNLSVSLLADELMVVSENLLDLVIIPAYSAGDLAAVSLQTDLVPLALLILVLVAFGDLMLVSCHQKLMGQKREEIVYLLASLLAVELTVASENQFVLVLFPAYSVASLVAVL